MARVRGLHWRPLPDPVSGMGDSVIMAEKDASPPLSPPLMPSVREMGKCFPLLFLPQHKHSDDSAVTLLFLANDFTPNK